LEMAFHRHDFGGLMFQRIESMLIAGHNLNGSDLVQRGRPKGRSTSSRW
jgi:hypothetical protein